MRLRVEELRTSQVTKEVSAVSQPGLPPTSRPPSAPPQPCQQTCPPSPPAHRASALTFPATIAFPAYIWGAVCPQLPFPRVRGGGADVAGSESLLRPLPHCFIPFCLPTHLFQAARVFPQPTEAGSRTRVGRKPARSGRRAGLFVPGK